MSHSLGEIAEISGAELIGDVDAQVVGAASLATASANEVSFLANKRHVRYLSETRAAAVFVSGEYAERCPVNTLVSQDPYLAFVKVLRFFHPSPDVAPGIHAAAIVSPDSRVAKTASVGAAAVIGSNSNVGEHTVIGPGCVIGADVEIGQGTRLSANVSICDGVTIGSNCILHPGVVIGADGFGIVQEDGAWLKIPQTGGVQIFDNVEIGANTTIDRGALDNTIIEEGVKLDNQIQVGHGVKIGAHTAIAGCVAIAGSTSIGKRCMIGGLSALSGHIEITDDVIITGMSGVNNSIKEAGIYSSGVPITDNAKWRKNMARLKNLDDITRRLVALEEKLAKKDSND